MGTPALTGDEVARHDGYDSAGNQKPTSRLTARVAHVGRDRSGHVDVLLRTMVSAWNVSVDYAAQDRVATRHRMSLFMRLPKQYVGRVRDVPGVKDTTYCIWFGARLPKKNGVFANIATDPESLLTVYDEIQIPPHSAKPGSRTGEEPWLERNWRAKMAGKSAIG